MSVLLKLRTLFLALCLVAATSCASHPPLGRQQFLADFDVLWSTLAEDYAYFDGKTTDWPKVRDIYRPLAGAATDKREFVGVLERTLDELYDPHTHLKANTAASYRLIPTGLDVHQGAVLILITRHELEPWTWASRVRPLGSSGGSTHGLAS